MSQPRHCGDRVPLHGHRGRDLQTEDNMRDGGIRCGPPPGQARHQHH